MLYARFHAPVDLKARSRSGLVSTDTELSAMVPAASMGESSQPKNGAGSSRP